MLAFAVFLALVWGCVWALFLQCHPLGQFLAIRRTWITVVIGVGGDLLIGLWVLELDQWLMMVAIITASSVGIVSRSLHNELIETRGVLDGVKESGGQQEVGQ